jgi:hypothetical protein
MMRTMANDSRVTCTFRKLAHTKRVELGGKSTSRDHTTMFERPHRVDAMRSSSGC